MGFTIQLPSTWAMRTAEIGPRKGTSERWSALEAPTKAGMSGGVSASAESTVAITWVSSR